VLGFDRVKFPGRQAGYDSAGLSWKGMTTMGDRSGVERSPVGRVLRGVLLGALAAGSVTAIGLGLALARLRWESPATSMPQLSRLRAPGGSLLVCGGKTPDEVRERFVELAGGSRARVVLIPTASNFVDGRDTARVLAAWSLYTVASLRILHCRSRSEADDPVFARDIAGATAVWIGGGDQRRLSTTYAGTEVERQLLALLARGGVVGGTSAGAAAMSRVMMQSGRRNGPPVLGLGLDLLPGVVIDQHFLRRNRMRRLTEALKLHPDLIGLGVDEQTALEVDVRSRRARVLGRSYVVAYVPAAGAFSPRVELLKPGDEADLDALRIPDSHAIASALELEAVQ
jgi:cyanophycinase